MSRFSTGFLTGLLLPPAAVTLYCLGGFFPAGATDSPLPLERQFAMMALHAAALRRAPKSIPLQPSEANLVAGARVYRQRCAECHGLPGRPDSPVAKGLAPPPPHLLRKGEMVTDDPAGETYWKAANGIRLTGMPAFVGSLSNDDLWQVSLFLANADRLPPAARAALAADASPAGGRPVHPPPPS